MGGLRSRWSSRARSSGDEVVGMDVFSDCYCLGSEADDLIEFTDGLPAATGCARQFVAGGDVGDASVRCRP